MDKKKLQELFGSRSKGKITAEAALKEYMSYIEADLSKRDFFFVAKKASYLIYFLAAYFEKIDQTYVEETTKKIIENLSKKDSTNFDGSKLYCKLLCQAALVRTGDLVSTKNNLATGTLFQEFLLFERFGSYSDADLDSHESYVLYSIAALFSNGSVAFSEAYFPGLIEATRNARKFTERTIELSKETAYLYEPFFLKAFLEISEVYFKGDKSNLSIAIEALIEGISDIEYNDGLKLEDPTYAIENDYFKGRLLLLYEETKKLIADPEWKILFLQFRYKLLGGGKSS